MARQRNLVVNIERMRRDMDELLGEGWASIEPLARGRSDFHPRVDVYYCEGPMAEGEEAVPKAVVTADIAGVGPDAVNVEISGRVLVISGKRPVRETEGRAYQQVEIPTGTFRRAIELGVDVDSSGARAAFHEGLLRIELPIELPEATARRVPVERSGE